MFDANLKRLPVLEVQGEMIGQSRAIERFVAKDLGLMGKGKIDEAKIDAICEHVRDLRDAYQKARGNPFAPPTPEIEEAMAKCEEMFGGGKLEALLKGLPHRGPQ